MKDIGKMAMFGLMAYVAYEMLVKGQTLSQAFSFIPGLGCVGAYGTHDGGMGMSGIAPTSLYGGYATLGSASMSTRAERSLNR